MIRPLLGPFRCGVSELSQERGERVHRQGTGVAGRFRHSTDLLQQLFASDLSRGLHALAFHQLRDRRSAGHGRDATLGAEADVRDAIPFQFQSEFQNIAAHRILQSCGRVGRFDLTCISRILKMIYKFGRIHGSIVMWRASVRLVSYQGCDYMILSIALWACSRTAGGDASEARVE